MKILLKNLYKKIIPFKLRKKIRKIYLYFDNLLFKREIKKQYFIVHGYKLNLRNPKSFSEKIFWKKLYYRDPLIKITTDKYLVRSYIKKNLVIILQTNI